MNTRSPLLSLDHRLSLSLVCLLMGLYLLIYANTPDSADGKALLAVSSAIVQHGRLDMSSVGASDGLLPRLAQIGAVGLDGALYAKKGIVPSLVLMPLVMLAQLLPEWSIRAAAMLLNPLITTLTALILYRLIRRLRYGAGTAWIVGLIYGGATMAAVYSKTLYGEPLSALLILGGVYCAHRWRETCTKRDLLLVGTLFALNVGVNTVYVFLLPLIALYCFGDQLRGRFFSRALIRDLMLFAFPCLMIFGGIALYNWARFGSPLTSGYRFADGEGFIHPIGIGFLALLISPWRGLFFYNPVLLLILPGWLRLRREHPRLAWLSLSLSLTTALSFASWWSWHGGIGWGPRFLIPALPLLSLTLAPLIQGAQSERRLWLPIGVLVGVSALIQFLGAFYSYFPYEIYLARNYFAGDIRTLASGLKDEVVFSLELSPLRGHWALFLHGWALDPAFARSADLLHAGMALALVALGGGIALWRGKLSRFTGVIPVAAVALCVYGVVARQTPSAALPAALEAALDPPGVTLVTSTLFEDSLLDVKNGSRIITMNAPTRPDDPDAVRLNAYARAQTDRLWLVNWFGAGDPQNWQERALWEDAYFVTERFAAGHRALLFAFSPTAPTIHPVGGTFGPDQALALARYGTQPAPDGIYVILEWTARQPIHTDYSWFVHLLDPVGEINAQQDRSPVGGYAPTSGWQVGQTITDRLFFPLASGTDTSGWRLRVGFPNPAGGLWPAWDSHDQSIPEGFILLDVAN
ncbi:MAG: hypothetical protein IT322_20545 [Anaerolineae bacterium]|nr:hypothetical protein [Anaerolineae bacterium]